MNNNIPHNKIPSFQSVNGVNNMNKNEKTYEENFYEMLDKVTKRAELEVPEYGSFAPVYEYFKNNNPELPIDRYQLKVLKMPKDVVEDEKQRYIEAAVFTPASDYKANILVGSGYKDDIIKQLKSDEFPEKLNDAYIKLVDLIKNPD